MRHAFTACIADINLRDLGFGVLLKYDNLLNDLYSSINSDWTVALMADIHTFLPSP